jgi:5-methylthioadenosine/S-adenosylhomocysteine deaminase
LKKRLIRNIDWIITVDAQRRMLTDGAIAIAGDRIDAVDKSATLQSRFEADEVIDGRGLIAIPGLIDTYVATLQQLGRGGADSCDLPKFMLERTLPYEAAMTADDAVLAARMCQLEMIHSGITCFADSGSRFPLTIAAIAAESGLRALLPLACYDVYDTFMGSFPKQWEQESITRVIDCAAETVDDIVSKRNPRIRPAISLPWLAAASDDLLRQVAALTRAKGVPAIAGAARSRDDAVASRRQHSRTEIARLDNAGLLRSGTVVGHAGWTSPVDLVKIKESGSSVACCPSSSQRLGTGALELGRYPELLAFGVNVTLGSGSAMASNYIDIARQLYLFSGGGKSYRLDATVIPPEVVLEMATVRAAQALGLTSDIGSLKPGMKADIAMFNLVSADWAPVINPIANLVFSSRGGAHTVIIDGEIVMSGGVVHTLDEERTLREGQYRATLLSERSGLARFCKPQWCIV